MTWARGCKGAKKKRHAEWKTQKAGSKRQAHRLTAAAHVNPNRQHPSTAGEMSGARRRIINVECRLRETESADLCGALAMRTCSAKRGAPSLTGPGLAIPFFLLTSLAMVYWKRWSFRPRWRCRRWPGRPTGPLERTSLRPCGMRDKGSE